MAVRDNDTLINDDLARRAKDLLGDFRAGDAAAISRAHEHLPQVKYGSRDDAAAFSLTLRDAQTVVARENNAQSFGELLLRIKLRDADYGGALAQFKALVYAGDADALDLFLTAHPDLKTTIDDPHFDFGSTALIIARHNLAMVDALLKHGADINTRSQWWAGDFTALEGANAKTARQLVERGADISPCAAAEQGWLDWLETAYADDPAIAHQRGGDGKTPLHYATDPAVMDWLLQRGADINARDIDHASTPLQWHLGERNIREAKALVVRGAQVDIFAAVMLGELELAKAAVAAHPRALLARVNQNGYELVPPADGSHMYVYAYDAAGMSPFQVALEEGQGDIFDWLLAQADDEARLLAHCARCDSEAAKRIAAANPELVANLPDGDKRQLIHAAWTGKAEVVALMAALGFDLHIIDDDKMTPLHAAAFHGFVAVIEALLSADAAPPLDWINRYGGTPLSTAMWGKNHGWRKDGDHMAAIRLLLDAGSEVKANWLPSGDDEVDAVLRAAL